MDLIINQIINKTLNNIIPKNSVEIPCYYNFLHHILNCLGYPSDHPPIAELLRQYYKLDGTWFIASPVYWQATFKNATINATDYDLELSVETSKSLFANLQQEFPEMRWHYHDEYIWLIQANNMPTINSKPPRQIRNEAFAPYVKNLDPTLFWQKFITESQLALASLKQHKTNSLWIWGQGNLLPKTNLTIVYDEPSLLPLISLLSNNPLLFKKKIPHNLPHDAIIVLQNNQFINLYKNTRWYWNNQAYQQSTSWLTRQYRRFKHAY